MSHNLFYQVYIPIKSLADLLFPFPRTPYNPSVRKDLQNLFKILVFVGFGTTGCGKIEALDKIPIQIGGNQVFVEIAATRESRRTGLMHRQSLKPNEGMLFIFPKPKILRFWMKDTPLSLDIGFFSKDGVLLKYVTMEPDGDKTIHQSPKPALYALEMNKGWFKSNKIAVGSKLVLRQHRIDGYSESGSD